MWTILEISASIIMLAIAMFPLCGAFWFGQLVVERFIEITIPSIALFIDKMRNPDQY